MSNEEKKRLEEYRKRRAKFILVQICILICLTLAFAGLVFAYQNVDKTYYITYAEKSNVDYKVKLRENNIYEEEYLGEDYSYVSSVIDTVVATFNYNIEIDAQKVSYDFSMKADASLQITDTSTNAAIYKKNYQLLPSITQKVNTNKLDLPLPLEIDYNLYNDEVKKVINTLDLKSTKATLLVTVTYNVMSACEDFDSNKNVHTLTLNIPLNVDVVKISESQSIPTAVAKTIACEKYIEKDMIGRAALIVLCVDAFCFIGLIGFIYLTRNTHINYSNKVKKIVNAYKSFIHKINNNFDTNGYQVLYVNTIREMLEIRDTIQSPILMSENEDKTMTQFIIPTTNNILYIHEIKIENYDEIYGINEETIFETPVSNEEVINEVVEEYINEISEVVEDAKEDNNEQIEEIIEETQTKEENCALLEESKVIEEVSTKTNDIVEEKQETETLVKEEVKKYNKLKPKIIIDNKGGYLLNVSIKTPEGDKVYKINKKKTEIDLNEKDKTNK